MTQGRVSGATGAAGMMAQEKKQLHRGVRNLNGARSGLLDKGWAIYTQPC